VSLGATSMTPQRPTTRTTTSGHVLRFGLPRSTGQDLHSGRARRGWSNAGMTACGLPQDAGSMLRAGYREERRQAR